MKITDHVLDGCWYKPSPNISTPPRFAAPPTLIVMHYTAGDSAKAAADWLCTPGVDASAHVVVDRDGQVLQIVQFNHRAWHAGTSSWRGRMACNAFSIGIEIANWGFCQKRADGRYYSHAGVQVPADKIVETRHKNGGPVLGWEIYPKRQLDAVAELTRVLLKEYPSITDIAGHDDVAPQNKVDPGPAFPMQRFRDLLAPRASDAPRIEKRRVIATSLNVRVGPGTQHDVLAGGPLHDGEVVTVLQDAGDWSLVADNKDRRGWVFDAWLASLDATP
ncbi:MAG TPA: N-acetylmuramoyl-L-alanine amidase [Vineibacter sp.]|nr:N-acetylmuramoyl-L-alanine amidase [Vineibacter sp.]